MFSKKLLLIATTVALAFTCCSFRVAQADFSAYRLLRVEADNSLASEASSGPGTDTSTTTTTDTTTADTTSTDTTSTTTTDTTTTDATTSPTDTMTADTTSSSASTSTALDAPATTPPTATKSSGDDQASETSSSGSSVDPSAGSGPNAGSTGPGTGISTEQPPPMTPSTSGSASDTGVKPTPAPSILNPTPAPSILNPTPAPSILIPTPAPSIPNPWCTGPGESPMSVEGVVEIFCVTGQACVADIATGACPGPQPGLELGSECARVKTGVYGCVPKKSA